MKINKSYIIAAILAVIFYMVVMGTSGYSMLGFPVETNISDAKFAGFFSRMTKLGPELKCNPGSADIVDPKTGARTVQSSYYTGGLLPGGYCDDQQVVNEAANYKLVGSEPALGD